MKFFVLAYFTVIFCNVLYNKTFSKKLNVFSKIQNNRIIIAISLFGASVGGTTIFGITNKAYLGAMEYCYGLILSILTFDVIFGVYIYPKIINKFKGAQLSSLLGNYYGVYGKYLIAICSIFLAIGFLAAQISILGCLFDSILEVPKLLGCSLAACCIILYTILGGKSAIILTGRTHFFLTLTFIPLITIYGINKIGIGKILCFFSSKDALFLETSSLQNIFFAALGFCCLNLSPASLKRSLLASDAAIARSAFLIKIGTSAVFILALIINGLIARQVVKVGVELDVMPKLIVALMPFWLQVCVIFGILSAILTTSDAEIDVALESIKQDILPLFFISHNLQRYFYIFSLFFIIGISLAIALNFDDAINLVLIFAGFWFPCAGVPIIASLYNLFLPKNLFIITSLLSFCIFCYFSILIVKYKFYSVIISTIFTILSFCIYGLYKRIVLKGF
jgi:SSS family solute:Na+ symporter